MGRTGKAFAFIASVIVIVAFIVGTLVYNQVEV